MTNHWALVRAAVVLLARAAILAVTAMLPVRGRGAVGHAYDDFDAALDHLLGVARYGDDRA